MFSGKAHYKWSFSIAMSYVNYGQTMERSTMFNGKAHYFDWAIFNSYVNVYQRVCSCWKEHVYIYIYNIYIYTCSQMYIYLYNFIDNILQKYPIS